ncbi:Palmitoyltransferase ZDHHC16 [Lamellibrachia satsuma]|nr:Palmitoyltransferase ZDHHC16 [Lamellibrachia satsuma]
MVQIRWVCSAAICGQTVQKIKQEWFMFKLTFWSLVYNSLASWINAVDILIQPLFWIIDHVIRYTGPAFILLVALLVSSVITVTYVYVLPYKLEQSVTFTGIHFVTGHWLLVNIVFHYVQATFTNPGSPFGEVPEVVSICKVCVAPKPPRTHHCSVCRRCVLKMDHHCPWLNNCVGFYNHRYFFLFSVYMCIASFYVSIITYPVFAIVTDEKKSMQSTAGDASDTVGTHLEATLESPLNMKSYYRKQAVVFVFVLSTAVSMALLLLISWHARLIHRGETSIEVYINSKETMRLRKNGLVSSTCQRYIEVYINSKETMRLRKNGLVSSTCQRYVEVYINSKETMRLCKNGLVSSTCQRYIEVYINSKETMRLRKNGLHYIEVYINSKETMRLRKNGLVSSTCQRYIEVYINSKETMRLRKNGLVSSTCQRYVEVYINSKETMRLRKNGLVFRNPYNLGAKRNWKMFLGLTHGRTFWRHVLLPSAHKPDGTGQTWDTSIADAERGLLLL